MLVKGLFRLFFNSNVRFNQKSFCVMNSLRNQSRFYFRNIQTSANVWESEKNSRLGNLDELPFRKYIEENNNFKRPVSEIINLNFSFDKNESLKLLVKLKENVDNDCLWQEVLDCLKREVKTFDVEDFLKIIALASDIKIDKNSQHFSDFISCLDDELKARTFVLNDILEILYVLKHTLFRDKSLKHFRFYLKLHRSFPKLHRFQPLQVTHIFYYLEEINNFAVTMYKYPLLKYAKENLSQLKIEEMGIILAALVRAKLFTKDVMFIQQITDKVLDKIETINSFQLYHISKFLLNCSSVLNSNVIHDFQGKLIQHISRFKPKALICVLLSGCPFSLNISFWNNVVETLETELKTLSAVDIERLTSITTAFKIENKEEFLKLAVEAFEQEENVQYCSKNFSVKLVSFCKHLVIHRIYPKKLLDIVLSKDFIQNMVTRSFSNEMAAWLFLNCSLQIDKPECQCMCLDGVLEQKIMRKVHYTRAERSSDIRPFKTQIRLGKLLKAIFGESAVVEAYCLPHFERGLVMRFDENFNATAVPQDFKFGSKKVVHAPLDQHLWICLNADFIPSGGPSPLQETFMRHLSVCGYKPILIDRFEFYKIERLEFEESKKYFDRLIQKALEETLKEKQEQTN